MAKLGDVIKISDSDYTALKNAGSAGYVINGVRYYYNENNIYLTPSNGGGGGTATDVQINGTSITSSNVANILTQGTYNSSTNKIATMSDVPTNTESTTNKVTSISASSTDTQYPSAKAVWDLNNAIEISSAASYTSYVNSSSLIPGHIYRITFYTCNTSKSNTSSAGHQFDILLRAVSTNQFDENARACLHDGDTYFANSKLQAWELKYAGPSPLAAQATQRFDWATTTLSASKGTIYYMKDEFGNEAPYDFKNILFTKSGVYTSAYTFNCVVNGVNTDMSVSHGTSCNNNVIKEYRTTTYGALSLPFNVLYTGASYAYFRNNFFDYNCNNNTLLSGTNSTGGFEDNHFGTNCTNITIGTSDNTGTYKNHSNTFEDSCSHITIGFRAEANKFESNCSYITLGNSVYNNIFKYNSFKITQAVAGTGGLATVYNCVFDNCEELQLGNDSSTRFYNMHVHSVQGIRRQGSFIQEQVVTVVMPTSSTNGKPVDLYMEGTPASPSFKYYCNGPILIT